jgi:hypothetical protein
MDVRKTEFIPVKAITFPLLFADIFIVVQDREYLQALYRL